MHAPSLHKTLFSLTVYGILAGAFAGIFTAMLITIAGAWPTISDKFGVPVWRAFTIHWILSSVSGWGFALLIGHSQKTWRYAILSGICFSIVLGLLAAWTMVLRTPVLPEVDWRILRVIVGHIIFGSLLGISWAIIQKYNPLNI